MAQPPASKPSFSSGQRWLGALNMAVMAVAALGLLVMANYLAMGHFRRLQLSAAAGFKLSHQTEALLSSLTNEVDVTIFFQANSGENEELYGLTSGLLNEYQDANPAHIHVSLLDYTRFPVKAKELLAKIGLTEAQEKDFVLFEDRASGHRKLVYAGSMAKYDFRDLMERRSKYVRRNAFLGEVLFTSAIYSVSNPQALKTYFLYGHGERSPGDPSGKSEDLGNTGYSKLAAILTKEIDSSWDMLTLRGTNDVPPDCQLLIVAGPRQGEFLPEEVNKIGVYLKQGGRLLALLGQPCGLEPVLKQWGMQLGANRVMETDPRWVPQSSGVFLTAQLNPPHPVVDALAKDQTPIMMVWTRPLLPSGSNSVPGAPEVTILAATSTNGVDVVDHRKGAFGLLAAIEQGSIKGVDTPRGEGTRIVLAGDSDFLDDQFMGSWQPNHDFAFLALSWLLHRPALVLEGLVPQPIDEYRLYLTSAQSATVRWLFLAGLPAGILALGGLVWLRRRR
ncbi:MAG TPA: Gldg family protein [Verrucomicrobiae bacterium]|jgi:hypothetical protein